MVKPRQWQPMFNGMLGLKQGYAVTNMPPGSCLDIKNMFLNGIGGKQSRGGYTELFHTTDDAGTTRRTSRIRSLIQYQPYGGTAQVLCSASTYIYKQNSTTTTTVRSAVSDDVPWEWIQYRDLILGVNGTDSSFLYNGTNYIKISITAPSTNVTATIGAGGTLAAGVHNYLVTFYDSTKARESEPFTVTSPATATSAGAPGNATVTLSNFPSPTSGEGVDVIRIYRKSPSETVYSRIGTVNVSALPTTFVDNGIASTTLTLEYDTGAQDVGRGPHPNSSIICECFDRIFMVDPTDPSILVYSKISEYWAYPTGNYYYVGRGDGSKIKRIEKLGKALLIHKGNAWYILEEDPASATAAIRMLSQVGTQDYRTSCVAHNQVVRLTTTGFYRSVPTEYSVTDIREDYIGSDIATYESEIDWVNSVYSSMYNYNAYNRRHVYYIEPVSPSYYSKCLVYDIVLSQWVYYEIGTDIYCVADYYYQNKKNMMFGDGYGIVWQWDVGDADGTATTQAKLNGTVTSATSTSITDVTRSYVDLSYSTDITSLYYLTGTPVVGATLLQATSGATGTISSLATEELILIPTSGTFDTAHIVTGTNPDSSTFSFIPSAITDHRWTVNEFIGVQVSTWTGTGALQKRRITSNTANTLNFDAMSTTPDSTTTYSVGSIEKYADEYWDSNGDPHVWKRMRWIVPYIAQTGDYGVEVSFKRDFLQSYTHTETVDLLSSSSMWGTFIWGSGTWGGKSDNLKRIRLGGKYHYYSIRYRNRYAGQKFNWNGHGAVFQVLYDRNK